MWVIPTADLGPYLAAEWGWHDGIQIGWIRRYRKRTRNAHGTVEEHTVVTSVADLAAADVLSHLRAHWTIETRGHSGRCWPGCAIWRWRSFGSNDSRMCRLPGAIWPPMPRSRASGWSES